MKLAWLTKLPSMGLPVRGEGASTVLTDVFPKNTVSSMMTPQQLPQASEPAKTNLWDKLVNSFKNMLPAASQPGMAVRQPFITPEQKRWKEQIETYAESPFEKSLFEIKKKANEYNISKIWAEGIKSPDPLTRDAALSLLRAYIAHTDMESPFQLSSHTQMKLLLFSPHLTEGPLGKAIVYEALFGLPIAQFLEFAAFLRKDFSTFPPVAQALILKQLLNRRKQIEKSLSEEDATALRKLIKALVIEFYSGKQEAMSQVLNQQEKIRLGFLKIQPVEEAYRQQLEEIERRYRLKLRQLKKRRVQKIAEAEEEKMRRIELIYDNVEGNLQVGLNELEIDLDEILAI